MAEPISRKQFFRQTFFKGVRLSAELLDALQPSSTPPPAPTNHAFEADFPPELLAAEAARLGIDPENKAAVLAAIEQQMEAPRS